jgi:transposase
MSKQSYDDNFKLEVVNAYLNGPHGLRVVARSYGLPSKNYIERWLIILKEKGLIPQDAVKSNAKSSIKASAQKSKSPYEAHQKSARESQLEKEVLRLQAEVDFLKKLKELGRRGF